MVAELERSRRCAPPGRPFTLYALGQMAFGAVETVFGAPVAVTATPAEPVGLLAVLHGLDNLQAGLRTGAWGEPVATFTQRGIAAGARWAGASDTAAEWIGLGGDVALGIGLFGGSAAVLRARGLGAPILGIPQGQYSVGAVESALVRPGVPQVYRASGAALGMAGVSRTVLPRAIGRAMRIGPPSNAIRRIYTATDDFAEVVRSGRVWGQTEGSVYGMRVRNASRLRTMMDPPVRDPGLIIFEGQAAALFKPHSFEGPWSGLKRLLGQQKAGFGDIVFDRSTALLEGNTLIIRNAQLGTHAGQSTARAAARLWSRRLILEPALTGLVGGAGWGAWELLSED